MRRALLVLLFGLLVFSPAIAQAPTYRAVVPGTSIRFPADHGAHPEFRTEWWYVTGWLRTEGGEQLGFQVTFFRSRPGVAETNPSAFAAKQVLFAHAALSDPREGKLLHGQRIARQGFGLAEAATKDMDLVIDDWRLQRRADGRIVTAVRGEGFGLDLAFQPTQAAILQGEAGYSRKGPAPSQASYYYSVPHLKVSGEDRSRGQAQQGDRRSLAGPGMVVDLAGS